MNKNTFYITIGIVGLTAAVSIGSAVSLASKNRAAKADILALQTQIANMEAAVPAISSEPEIIYLSASGDTNELVNLKNELAAKDAALAALKENSSGNNRRNGNRQSFEERMAKMKEEDPDGYAKMVTERSERQQQMRYSLAERTASFMDMDTSMMTEEELANHDLLVEKMAQVWAISEQLQDAEAAPNRETMREMRDLSREVQTLLNAERTVMFKLLGTELGYNDADAATLAAYADEIVEATTFNVGRGGGRGR